MKRFISVALLVVIMSFLIIGCQNNKFDYVPMPSDTNTDISEGANDFPGHEWTDDGDCTTPIHCNTCNELLVDASTSHKYEKVIEYSFVDENINMGGVKTVACTNPYCSSTKEVSFSKFINALGYSILEFEESKSATMTASYFFNSTDLIDYSNYLNEATQKRLKFEYGMLVYMQGQVNGAPISNNGTVVSGVAKADLTRSHGISDFSVPKIGQKNYDTGIFICAYLILGNDVYYIQGDNVYTASEYKSLKPVTVNMILGNE